MRSFAVAFGLVLLAAGIVRAQEDVQARMKSCMSRMVNGLNAGVLKDLGGITCWTCHRGRTIPARVPRAAWEKIQAEHAAEFEGRPNRALAMSVYAASLGVDRAAASIDGQLCTAFFCRPCFTDA